MAEATRIETDALGPVEVSANRLWGAQTERSRRHFAIGGDRYRWGRPVIRAFALLKRCAAQTNAELELLSPDKASGASSPPTRTARR